MNFQTVLGRDSTAILSLTAIWLFVELLIHPAGEFPLNDDWSYTRSLQQWYETHHYYLLGWTSMPLVAHLAWGMLFCKIFGFSFTVLRYSTLVLGCIGGIGAYFLTREFSENKAVCFFSTLVLLLNPIYLNLSNTFMTDVPFSCFLILSILFFVKGLRQGRLSYIVQGILFVTIATMIRQLGLLAAGAFSVAMLMRGGLTRRYFLIAALATGLPAGIYLLYNHWLTGQHIDPVKYDEGFHRIRHNLFGKDHSAVKYLLRQALNIFVYAGFFIFPLIFRASRAAIWRSRRSPAFLTCVIVMAGIGVYCLVHRNNIPLMGNVMNPYGVGPVDLRDITLLRLDHIHPLPAIVWQLLCLSGIVGGGILLWAMFHSLRNVQRNDRLSLWFLFCFAGIYCLVMLMGGTYDRYLIPLIPVLSVLLLTGLAEQHEPAPGKGRQLSRYAGIFFLLVGGWFSIAGTTNYLSWNRARWNGLRYLTHEAGIPPSRID
ncbi:MAG TPA: glycosyltransferase family 39 protein, partial [Puia sp.]